MSRPARRDQGATPEECLLAIFDVFDEWFHEDGFDGCSFINVLLETADLEHPVGQASVVHLENIRSILRSLAGEAGLRDPDGFARKWHILMKGSIVSAGEGDLDAAKRAQEIGRLVLAEYRRLLAWLLSRGQEHPERGAASGVVLDPGPPAVHGGELRDEREPDPGPAGARARRLSRG